MCDRGVGRFDVGGRGAGLSRWSSERGSCHNLRVRSVPSSNFFFTAVLAVMPFCGIFESSAYSSVGWVPGPPWILSQKQPFWTLLMPKMNKSLVQASFLRNIQELSLEGPSCSVCDLAEVFSLPFLRSLRVRSVIQSERDQGLREWMFQPRSNRISTLALTYSKISRQALGQVLHSCTALEDLTYIEVWDHRNSENTFTWVTQDFDSLIKVLSPFHKTLKTLKLQNDCIERIPTKHSPIRTLTQFTILEHFSTVMFAIKNNGSRIQEILPGSLVELELSDTSLETDGGDVSDGDDVSDGNDVCDRDDINDTVCYGGFRKQNSTVCQT